MKIEKGWTVYIVVELFRNVRPIAESYYDKIACKVLEMPKKSGYEYKLKGVNNKLYFRKQKDIYITPMEAIQEAERQADKEDRFWELVNHGERKCWRPWRDKK